MNNHYLFLTEGDFVRVMALQPDPRLRAELEQAIIVPADAIPAEVVTMYSHVRYRDEHTGTTREIQIVLPEDADLHQGKVSVLAPVGAALLGLEVGQVIDWKFPGGETRQLRVEKVLHDRAPSVRVQQDVDRVSLFEGEGNGSRISG